MKALYAISAITLLSFWHTVAAATDYVISTQADFDLRKAQTFLPGDRILFQRGAVFTGQFFPKGSGTAAQPIIVDATGSGAKPIINGNGVTANDGATVRLHNSEYWRINNLDITNNSTVNAVRRGIYVTAADIGVADSIHIINNTVRNVRSDGADKLSGGIFVRVTGTAISTRWDDVLIQGNTVQDVGRSGIATQSTWINRMGITTSAGPWNGFTNVRVRSNVLRRIDGDGIVVRASKAPVIEYNLAVQTGNAVTNPPFNAGIWSFNSDDVKIQYNEAYGTRKLAGNVDGQGFDADYYSNNTIIQYNYSHDNEGGFLLVMGGRQSNPVIRYNVSQNDATVSGSPVITLNNLDIATFNGAQIYNNTIYLPSSNNSAVTGNLNGIVTAPVYFFNNLIYKLGTGGYSTVGIWERNLFYGNHPASEPADPSKITANPLLVAPGTGGSEIDMASVTRLPQYKLQSGSPAIDAGGPIVRKGFNDFYGGSLDNRGCPDIGAHEFGGTGTCARNVVIPNYISFSLRNFEYPTLYISSEPGVANAKAKTSTLPVSLDKKWRFNIQTSGNYRISSDVDGRYLDYETPSGILRVEASATPVAADKLWQVYEQTNGYYYLRSSGIAQIIDLDAGIVDVKTKGTPIPVGPDKLWTLEY